MRRILPLTLLLFISSACATPGPVPATLPASTGSATPTTRAAPAGSATPVPPLPTALPSPTATPVPIELVICQSVEPLSLYLYGGDRAARAGIAEAVFDGPIDAVGFSYQPVILEQLPSLENGQATVNSAAVRPGDPVVDAFSGAVMPLAGGVQLLQADGSVLTYTGSDPAQAVQVSAEFRLRPEVRWSDGQPLTAADSVFSFQVAADPDTPASKFLTDRTARYEAVDDLQLRWTGLPGWRDPQFFLRFWTPLPRHQLDGLSARELLSAPAAAEHPLGWGPFQIESWQRGDRLTLVRNPLYFRAADGLPRVDRVVFRFGLDAAAALEELRAGRCQISASETDFSAYLPDLASAAAAGQLAPQFSASPVFEHLDFGIQPAEGYKRAAGNDLFQDVRVRQAFAYCLDRQALIDQFVSGLGQVPAAYVPETHPLYAADRVTLYPFDPARGLALLAQAGWSDSNGDGVLDQARRRLSLEDVSGPEADPFRVRLMGAIQAQYLANCGLELKLVYQPAETLYAAWPVGPLFGRRFDLGQFPWRTGSEPPCELYLSSSLPTDDNPGGANNTGYQNPDFDRACQSARAALDEAGRRSASAEALALFTRDLPSLPLFWRVRAGVARPEVSGYQMDPTSLSELWNLEAIALPRP